MKFKRKPSQLTSLDLSTPAAQSLSISLAQFSTSPFLPPAAHPHSFWPESSSVPTCLLPEPVRHRGTFPLSLYTSMTTAPYQVMAPTTKIDRLRCFPLSPFKPPRSSANPSFPFFLSYCRHFPPLFLSSSSLCATTDKQP
jgi:hypothetical protein